ncbi:MAG: RHS repeat domain-containing protein [Terriglobales bacterium]
MIAAGEIAAALAQERQFVTPEGTPFPLLSLGDVLVYGAIMAQMASATGPADNPGEGAKRTCAWHDELTTAGYVYDRFGNRWQENAVAGTVPTAAQLSFDANNHIVGASYDAAGDLLEDAAGNSYAYSARHRVATADGGNIQYVYNARSRSAAAPGDGRRVERNFRGKFRPEKLVGGVAKYYLYDPAGRAVTVLDQNGNWLRGEIFAGGRHIATYVSGTTDFEYSDWLGTERLTATLSGYEQDACTSLPFGDDLNCTGSADPSPLHFTGQQHDSETGLDHFSARNYTSTWGVWVTPDRSGTATALSNPQSWDLNVYCLDDPLTLLDPDGKAPIPPLVLWSLQHFSSYVQMRSTVLAADYAADRSMIMPERMGEALDATLGSGGPPAEFPDAENAHNEGAFQHLSDLEAPAAGAVLKAQVVKWMNAKTTSAGDLQAALGALKASQAVTAKMGEAGNIAGKAAQLPGVSDLPAVGTFLKVTGGLLQFAAGPDQHERGYLLRQTLIPLMYKKIEQKKAQPGDCMLKRKACKE